MAYEISRDYDTDESRSNIRTILANIARRLNDAHGRTIPTKTIFEEPDIICEEDNHFSVPVRPTVTEAGFEPSELVGSCNYNGRHIRVTGSTTGAERDTLRVKVTHGESNHEVDIETLEEIWSNMD